ncbi:MAG: rhodanese-like domain-containing protein [Lacunisphaera sp.]|nr:rhodanese-like domain-containing protein [Lacunisphaera sp.]
MNTSLRPLMRECALVLLLAAIPAMLTVWLHPKRAALGWSRLDLGQVELSEVKGWQSPVLWVDAREDSTYTREHIPDAVLLNETEWNRLIPGFLEVWRPDVRVVVYCGEQTCNASEEVARRLRRELNLTDVYVLKGGWDSWQSQHR